MSRWLFPVLLLLLGTVLSAGAGWAINTVAASWIAPGEGETLPKYERVARQAAGSPGGTPQEGTADAQGGPAAVQTEAGQPPAPATPPGLSRKEYIDAVVKRSIFDSTKVGGSSAGGDCVGEGCDGEKSDLPFSLLATLVAIPEDRSSALLFNENTKEAWGYGIGARLMDATILTIEANRVTVQRGDGSREFITVQGQDDKPTTASTEPEGDGANSGEVTQISDTEFEVSRSLLDRYLGDMDSLSKLARARPHKDEAGNSDGYRLSGVRRNEALYQLGIRSGDIVHSVNGKPLSDMSGAMAAFSQLQGGSDFSFEITRRGERKTMSYRVK